MKFINYLRLFYFISRNWNIRLACFTLYHEIRGESKYGLNTSRIVNVKELAVKGDNLSHAENYQGASYFLLENIFAYIQQLNIPGGLRLLDLGCGKGRAVAVAAWYGCKTITGVEFAEELYKEAQKNITAVRARFSDTQFTLVLADAADYSIADDTNVFFFFNPFDETIMLRVIRNILSSLKKNAREVYVIYINPVHRETFLSAGFEQIYHLEKFIYIQAEIYMLPAS